MAHKLLKTIALLILVSIQQTSFSQVTLVSNNTSLGVREGGVVNGKAVLVAANDSIWVTGGTTATTKKLTTKVSFVDSGGLALYNNKAFFTGKNSTNGLELWATDGSDTGTKLIKDIRVGTGSSIPQHFFVFNNKVYFTANDGTHGKEVWVSNGTTTGTVLLKDIYPGTKSSIDDPQFFADSTFLLFMASDSLNGEELWKTNGTAAGTTLVKNITAGKTGTDVLQFIRLSGNLVIFAVTVPGFPIGKIQIWKTDGTSTGTTLLKDFGAYSAIYPPSFFKFKGKIYFAGTSFTTTGTELWVTNGTTTGTTLVKDIYKGQSGSYPNLFDAIIIGSKFYFSATDSLHGTELWGTDGTATGTLLVKDINPGKLSSTPFILKNFNFTKGLSAADTSLFNGKIFMVAQTAANGAELWITNGTATGTLLVKDIKPGKKGGLDSLNSYFYTSTALYFNANDSIKGIEPWKSNGTSTGTTLVADINPGTKSSKPEFLFIFNNQLYLNANNGDNTAGKTDLFKVNATVAPLYNILVASEKLSLQDDALDLNLSPNPVQSQLNVRFSATEAGNISLRIIDDNGQILLKQDFGNNKTINQTINVSTLPQGLYFLQLIKGKEVRIAKFIKE
jgi:ELWxxDGT repeat protein